MYLWEVEMPEHRSILSCRKESDGYHLTLRVDINGEIRTLERVRSLAGKKPEQIAALSLSMAMMTDLVRELHAASKSGPGIPIVSTSSREQNLLEDNQNLLRLLDDSMRQLAMAKAATQGFFLRADEQGNIAEAVSRVEIISHVLSEEQASEREREIILKIFLGNATLQASRDAILDALDQVRHAIENPVLRMSPNPLLKQETPDLEPTKSPRRMRDRSDRISLLGHQF